MRTQRPPMRIIGLDIARAFAIVGMVIVNFTVSMGADQAGPMWLRMFAASLTGRAAATFVVLAGIGASLGARRAFMSGDQAQQQAARRTMWKRALFLFVIGWLLFPIWPADILHYYGVYLAVGAFVLFASARTLLVVAAVAVASSAAFIVLGDPFANWNISDYSYNNLWTPAGFARNLFLDGFHPVLPWIAFYLFGIWVGRTDLRDRRWRRRLAIVAAGVVVVVEGLAWGLLGPRGGYKSAVDDESWQQLFATDPIPPLPMYVLAGAATAVLVIVASIELGERLPSPVTEPLVFAGQMALTTYVAHVVVGLGTLEEIGRLEEQTLSFAVASALVFCAGVVIASWLWRKRFARGPIETLMRRIAG